MGAGGSARRKTEQKQSEVEGSAGNAQRVEQTEDAHSTQTVAQEAIPAETHRETETERERNPLDSPPKTENDAQPTAEKAEVSNFALDLRSSIEVISEAPAKHSFSDFSPVRGEEYRAPAHAAPPGPELLQEELLSSLHAVPMSPPLKYLRKLELSSEIRSPPALSDTNWKPVSHSESVSVGESIPCVSSMHPQACLSPEIRRPAAYDESLDEEVLRSIDGFPTHRPFGPGKIDLTESAGRELDSLLNLMDSK